MEAVSGPSFGGGMAISSLGRRGRGDPDADSMGYDEVGGFCVIQVHALKPHYQKRGRVFFFWDPWGTDKTEVHGVQKRRTGAAVKPNTAKSCSKSTQVAQASMFMGRMMFISRWTLM